MTESQARTELEPLLPTLWQCVDSAFKDWLALDPVYRMRASSRTRSSFLNDLMVHHAMKAFEGDGSVRWVRVHGQYLMLYRETFLVKLKKLTGRLRPMGIPTHRSQAFMAQGQLQMPGLAAPAVNIVAGYQVGALALAPKGVFVVCPDGEENSWVLVAEAPATIAVHLPAGESETPQLERARRPVLRDGVREEHVRHGAAT